MPDRRTDFDPEAGVTVLELLVVLVITILVTGLIAASLQPALNERPSSFDAIAAFVVDARLQAIRTGQAGILMIGGGTMTYQGKALSWDTQTTAVSVGQREGSDAGQRVVVYADGSMSGPAIEIIEQGVAKALRTPYRPASLHAGSD